MMHKYSTQEIIPTPMDKPWKTETFSQHVLEDAPEFGWSAENNTENEVPPALLRLLPEEFEAGKSVVQAMDLDLDLTLYWEPATHTPVETVWLSPKLGHRSESKSFMET